MTTVHEHGANIVLDRIRSDPESMQTLLDTRDRIRNGELLDSYITSLGQRQHGAEWPLEQYAAWLMVHANIMRGEYATVEIEVGDSPGPDCDRDGNAARLADLPAPFVARVDIDQNNADQDGRLYWTEPITVWKSTGCSYFGDHGAHYPVLTPHRMRPGSVPLEIGTTLPSRSMAHLFEDTGVARWAYGSDDLKLIVWVNNPRLKMGF